MPSNPFKVIAGFLFLIFGVLGLFLPFLQGILFLAVGFVLLSSEIPVFGKWLNQAEVRFPKLKKWIQKARKLLGS